MSSHLSARMKLVLELLHNELHTHISILVHLFHAKKVDLCCFESKRNQVKKNCKREKYTIVESFEYTFKLQREEEYGFS